MKLRKFGDNSLKVFPVFVDQVVGLVHNPDVAPRALHAVNHDAAAVPAGQAVYLAGNSAAVLGMYHVDEFVVKQILYLLPAVTGYLKETAADISEVKVLCPGAAVIAAGHVIVENV